VSVRHTDSDPRKGPAPRILIRVRIPIRTRRLLALVERHPVAVLSLLFVLCVAVFLATISLPRVDNLLIGSDGILYYHYVRSFVIDGDLDFTNEYLYFNGPAGVPAPTPAGLPPNRMSIGMGVVWLPFFLLAHAIAGLLDLPTDGYSYLYQAAVCLGSMVYGFIGLLMIYRLCRQYADAVSSVVSVVLIWFGSNVIYYMVAEPSMSHMVSLGVVSSFLAWWRLSKSRGSVLYWAVLGALGGLAALIRLQNVLFLMLPAVQWLFEGARPDSDPRLPDSDPRLPDSDPLWQDRRREDFLVHVGRGALMGLAAVLVFSMQLWAWQTVYGSVFASGYAYGSQRNFYWLSPQVLQVLFSLRHGFFTWHPIYLVGAVGLWWVAREDADKPRPRAYALLLVLAFALQVYLVAAWRMWWQADAFGGRMLISTAPVFALGLAQIVKRLRQANWLWVVIPGGAILLWNLAFFVQYRFGFIPMGEAITFRQLVWDKFTLPVELLRRVLR